MQTVRAGLVGVEFQFRQNEEQGLVICRRPVPAVSRFPEHVSRTISSENASRRRDCLGATERPDLRYNARDGAAQTAPEPAAGHSLM